MPEPLTADDIAERRAALVAEAAQERISSVQSLQAIASDGLKYVRPFSQSYDGVVAALENPENRILLGLAEIDMLTRGFGPNELILIAGFAHSGKTQLINTMICNNRDRRILFFSMDDPAEMILIKLTCMLNGVSADDLEQRVRAHDHEARAMLERTATTALSNLLVVDDSLGLTAMGQAVEEATRYWGAGPELVILDFLGSMQGNGRNDDAEDGGIKSKAAAVKRWCKDLDCPLVVVHQNTRSHGAAGEPVTMRSIAFGGEQEATMLIGVRRRRDDQSLDGYMREKHKNTVTLHVAKNKRPPGKLTPAQGIDFQMEPDTGLIRLLREEDWPASRPNQPLRTSGEALDERRRMGNA